MIKQKNLIEFIEISKNNNINFPRYTYKCGATAFIERCTEQDLKSYKSIYLYKFKSFYLNCANFSFYPYQVLFIPEKSYLMYEELKNNINIWVCYTELDCRSKGRMTLLLKHLMNTNPDKKIIIDSNNESLRRVCKEIGIGLFKK